MTVRRRAIVAVWWAVSSFLNFREASSKFSSTI